MHPYPPLERSLRGSPLQGGKWSRWSRGSSEGKRFGQSNFTPLALFCDARYGDGDGDGYGDDEYMCDDGIDDDDDDFGAVRGSLNKKAAKLTTSAFSLNSRGMSSNRKSLGSKSSSRTVTNICKNCGAEHVKWLGKCPTCGGWGTLVETEIDRVGWLTDLKSSSKRSTKSLGTANREYDALEPVTVNSLGYQNSHSDESSSRYVFSNNTEINTVLGGGLTLGSLTLIGGAPGVGKSTLLAMMASEMAGEGKVIYASGEESSLQVCNRFHRLSLPNLKNVQVLSTSDADSVVNFLVDNIADTKLLILDSVQTFHCSNGGPSSLGGVSQVKSVTEVMLRLSKSTEVPVIMVGHVTKTGGVAGPRTVEHMVDAVVMMDKGEGSVRVCRVIKNR